MRPLGRVPGQDGLTGKRLLLFREHIRHIYDL